MSASFSRAEAMRKADLSRQEAANLVERSLFCPECGYKSGTVFSDCTGHMTIKCHKCKQVSILNLAYFRRSRNANRQRNYHSYF